jgi:hypothetical protein
MRKALIAVLMLAIVTPALAVEGSDVAYTGGTVSQLKEGVVGKFDLTRGTGLLFVYPGGSFEIPYTHIESYEHTQEVAVHLGVAPAIAVGLVKRRRKNHFVRITFKDGDGVHQVVVFEIPKTMPAVLMPTLAARAPAPKPPCNAYGPCYPLSRMNAVPLKPEGNAAIKEVVTVPATAPK